jgi:type IV pilus assembly protein PilN
LININLLPKNLRRVRESGYWRLLAIAFPLLVVGVIFVMQFLAFQTVQNLEGTLVERNNELELLRPAIAERADLLRRQTQLNQLITIRNQVRENRVVWTNEITTMLETLPSGTVNGRPVIDFGNLTMRSVVPPRADPNRFEGAEIIAEMNVSGTADGSDVLAEFIRNLENSAQYGVLFQNANRQPANDIFNYSLTIGALSEDGR